MRAAPWPTTPAPMISARAGGRRGRRRGGGRCRHGGVAGKSSPTSGAIRPAISLIGVRSGVCPASSRVS